jgi:GNAT superfamily N-acetyltransferase
MRNDQALAVQRRLIESGVVAPLSVDHDEVRRWLGSELASLIEGHLHQMVEPDALPDPQWAEWERRVTYKEEGLGNPHEWLLPCWLLSGVERVGMLAIQSIVLGLADICLASLYVRPGCRRQGLATRALEAVHDATKAAGGAGVRIPTSWCWQHAVRFYTRRGLWVHGWKHSLVFVRRPDLPMYRVSIDGSMARFLILRDGTWTPLFEATNGGTVLEWIELSGQTRIQDSWSVCHYAPGTFAMHLALAGWPLIRSSAQWEQRYMWSDCGQPEGLALKIALFEAEARTQGYDIKTPRIPGLDYSIAEL